MHLLQRSQLSDSSKQAFFRVPCWFRVNSPLRHAATQRPHPEHLSGFNRMLNTSGFRGGLGISVPSVSMGSGDPLEVENNWGRTQ